jgi:hypothetical protein
MEQVDLFGKVRREETAQITKNMTTIVTFSILV